MGQNLLANVKNCYTVYVGDGTDISFGYNSVKIHSDKNC